MPRTSSPPLTSSVDARPLEVRHEVTPAWAFRLPRSSGMDGVTRVRGGVLHRLLHRDGLPVLVRVAQPGRDRVVFGAQAERREDAEWGIARMRFALGVDDDLRAFYDRFRDDPLIGRSLRTTPWLRIRRRPLAFEALAWTITEQLIEYERAAAIQRRIVFRFGPVWAYADGLRDVPDAATLAAQAPALLSSMDLAPKRAIALVRVAREVADGRIALDGPDIESGWRRLRMIPEIGRWTTETLALLGQGRTDILPAGDLTYLKLAGRLLTGDPQARTDEEQARTLFARYEPWVGLAAAHALQVSPPGRGGILAPPAA